MTILIVDDSASIRTQLKLFLKSAGYTDLILAESPEIAFRHLGLEGPPPPAPLVDLILMDIRMKEFNGIDACRKIKSTSFLEDIPVIMVTGESSPEFLTAAFDAGAIDYIVKPLKKLQLIVRVRSALKLKREIEVRKNRENALLNSEARYRAIVQDQTDFICRFSSDRVITFMNEAYTQYFGEKVSYLTRLDPSDTEYVLNRISELSPKAPMAAIECKIKRPDGELRWHQWVIRAIVNGKEEITEYQSVGRDITDKKRAELEQLHREKLQGVLEMAGAVCHELNQPLQTITGFSELLLFDLDENHPNYKKIKTIRSETERMGQITRKLTEITKYETKNYIDGLKIIDIDKASNR